MTITPGNVYNYSDTFDSTDVTAGILDINLSEVIEAPLQAVIYPDESDYDTYI